MRFIQFCLGMLISTFCNGVCFSQDTLYKSSFERINTISYKGVTTLKPIDIFPYEGSPDIWTFNAEKIAVYQFGENIDYHKSMQVNGFNIKPLSGNKYLGIYTYSSQSKKKEILQIKIKNKLKKNSLYEISLYAQSQMFLTSAYHANFGVAVGTENNSILTWKDTLMFNGFITDQGWQHLTFRYLAEGGENVFVIGGFRIDNYLINKAIDLKYDRPYKDDNCNYIVIDDVVIRRITTKDSLVIESKENQANLKNSLASKINRSMNLAVNHSCKNTDKQVKEFYYEINSNKLSNIELKRFNQFLKDMQLKKISSISIVGYTDQLGTVQYNRKLASERANNTKMIVLKYFSNNNTSITTQASDLSNLDQRKVVLTFYYSGN